MTATVPVSAAEIGFRMDESAVELCRLQGELDLVQERIGGALLDRETTGYFDAKAFAKLTEQRDGLRAQIVDRQSVIAVAAERRRKADEAERDALYVANVARLKAITATKTTLEAAHVAAVKAVIATSRDLIEARNDYRRLADDIQRHETRRDIVPSALAGNRAPFGPYSIPSAFIREANPYLPPLEKLIDEHRSHF